MGDFTGFTFGGYHSFDDLGIVRVSGGDRYEEELQPEVKDKTAEVPGLNGEYYFGSDYAPKKINIEIAFDSLTEEQFRKLRRVFGTKRVQELIFDERPYKKYMAKIESPIELSYVCFDEPKRHQSSTTSNGIRRDRENDQEYVPGGEITDSITVLAGETTSFTLTHVPNGEVVIEPMVEYVHEEGTYIYSFSNEGEEPITITLTYTYDATPFEAAWEQVIPWVYEEGTQRVYKGEGKISFVCYFPFAKSVYKELPYSYQLTTDTEIQSNKKYFKLESMLYVVVTEPDVSEIDTYYERVTNKECEEWAISSGLLTADQREEIDIYKELDTSIYGFRVYNAGDIDTGFRLYIPKSIVEADDITLTYKADQVTTTAALLLKQMTLKTNDVGVLIDTNNQTIVGVSQFNLDVSGNAIYTTTGNLYNEYVDSGYFFHLEPNTFGSTSIIEVTNGSSDIKIFYDYLYF